MSSRWTPEKIHQRRWFTLIAICLAVTITSIDNTIMNVGLPSIVREVGASQAQLQWLIDSSRWERSATSGVVIAH
jgi:type II secretory pathway component PulJ